MTCLEALKLAYRKHVLNDDSIGWDELGHYMQAALCNEMGDDGYQKWMENPYKEKMKWIKVSIKGNKCECKQPDFAQSGSNVFCLICGKPSK